MRLLRSLALASLFLAPTVFAACGDDGGTDEEPFDTFSDCFIDHHEEESFSVVDSIKICCIDHPIGGLDANVACGETAAACDDFVGTELDPAASDAEVTQACDEYIVERDQ
jgi:hypothetical protein